MKPSGAMRLVCRGLRCRALTPAHWFGWVAHESGRPKHNLLNVTPHTDSIDCEPNVLQITLFPPKALLTVWLTQELCARYGIIIGYVINLYSEFGL